MKKNNLSKLGLIFAVFLFSIACISISYSGFTDNIEISGTVETGFWLASISDFVWNDQNGNGIQDPGEPGISDVIVILFNETGIFISSTLTDSYGLYIFSDLTPGNYFLQFIPPEGYSFTIQDSTVDDSVDSDVDPSTGLTIMTYLAGGENDITWDCGLVEDAQFSREGCTPGFWKNHLSNWYGYAPDQILLSVFSSISIFPDLETYSMVEALDFGGGPGELGGAEILLRAGVAAVLNAAHPEVNYPLSESEIINNINSALDSYNRDIMINLAEDLDVFNNLGCPCN